MRQYFVTGTDTGVGKTHVSSALAHLARGRGQRVFAFKPIETGCIQSGTRLVGADQMALVEAAGGWQQAGFAGVYQFAQPAAPFVAAQSEGVEIDLERIVRIYREGLADLLGAPAVPAFEAASSLSFSPSELGEAGASGGAVPVEVPKKEQSGSMRAALNRARDTGRLRVAELGIADGFSGRRRSRELSVPVRLTTPALGILASDPLYEHYLDGSEVADPNQPTPDPGVPPGLCLVEGAGGWKVPITRTVGMSGLARRIGAPVIVVARATLGTINHSMLTIEAVERDGLRVAALVLSGLPSDDRAFGASNAAELRRLWKGQVVELWNDPSVLGGLLE